MESSKSETVTLFYTYWMKVKALDFLSRVLRGGSDGAPYARAHFQLGITHVDSLQSLPQNLLSPPTPIDFFLVSSHTPATSAIG